jgi:hypothetical protein
MLSADLRPGTEYAFREKRITGAPLHRILLIEHIRRDKWKAKWIDPNPGLIDYVTTAQILVPWREHKAFLKEEVDRERLAEHNDQNGFEGNSPLDKAVQSVYDNTGEGASYNCGVLRGTLEQLERIKARAGYTQALNLAPAYTGRDGFLYVPFEPALALARKFCMEEPAPALADIEAHEKKWSAQAARLDGEYVIPLLNEYRAAWALVRQWCGTDAAIASRENRISALERLVWDAVYALQKAGLDREANKLRTGLGLT